MAASFVLVGAGGVMGRTHLAITVVLVHGSHTGDL